MTPAIDLLSHHKIAFQVHQYDHNNASAAYGEEAAQKLDVDPNRVFKTLVVSNPESKMAVAVVPVSTKLNMKLVAKALGWKKAVMADKLAVNRSTGYVLGGVSPVGQKRALPTIVDSSSKNQASIFVSAGKRGLEIELSAHDLVKITRASFAQISECSLNN